MSETARRAMAGYIAAHVLSAASGLPYAATALLLNVNDELRNSEDPDVRAEARAWEARCLSSLEDARKGYFDAAAEAVAQCPEVVKERAKALIEELEV